MYLYKAPLCGLFYYNAVRFDSIICLLMKCDLAHAVCWLNVVCRGSLWLGVRTRAPRPVAVSQFNVNQCKV